MCVSCTSRIVQRNEISRYQPDILAWDKEEVRKRFKNSPGVPGSEDLPGSGSVSWLGPHTVGKIAQEGHTRRDDPIELEPEVLALEFVRRHTSIPVPRIYPHLGIKSSEITSIIVLDYVDGERLDAAWPKLSIISKLRVAWTLRGYIRQLRRIPARDVAYPGPLGPRPRQCFGINFGVYFKADPFEDQESLADHLRNRAEYTRNRHGKPARPDLDASAAEPLVFTHHDLQMRNIILGKDGRIWLIDWGWSGFFPEYFERIAMSLGCTHDKTVPKSWYRCIPFIAGPFFDRELWRYQRCVHLRWIPGPTSHRFGKAEATSSPSTSYTVSRSIQNRFSRP